MTNTTKPSGTATVPSAQHPSDTVKHRWLGFFAVLTALIMNILDSTIVNVAAPSIRTELGASYSDLQWIAAGYTLALAVGLMTGGRLGDLFGRRTMMLIGVAGFAGSSLACAAAPDPGALIAARVIQGLFGAVMIPQGFGLLRDLFPPQELGKAFGALGPVIGLSTILGPIVAGSLIDANLFGTGWRMVFGINLPLAAFALFGGLKALPRRARADAATRSGGTVRLDTVRLDTVGALLAGTGMFLLVYPLVQGRELGWPSWMAFVAAGAVAVFALFAAQQARRSRRGAATLVEFSVLTKRSYASGTLFTLVFFGGIVGFSLTVGLLLQLGFGYTPVHAALAMTAWAVGAFFGAGFSAGMMHKLGRRILHLGLSIMAVSLVGLYLVLAHSHAALTTWNLAPPLGAYGLGMGMIFVPLFDIIMGEVSDREVGSASAILESLQQLGASVGVAGLGTVFFGTIGAHPHTAVYLQAAERVTLITIALVAAAFALGFLLPHRARHAAPAANAPESAVEIEDINISELEPATV